MKIFTIGYEGNTAEEFFIPLLGNKVKKVIDIRLKPHGGGFAKKRDSPFFLSRIGGIEYQYMPECAPSRGLFNDFRNGEITWSKFKKGYQKLLKERGIFFLFPKRVCQTHVFSASKPFRIIATGEYSLIISKGNWA